VATQRESHRDPLLDGGSHQARPRRRGSPYRRAACRSPGGWTGGWSVGYEPAVRPVGAADGSGAGGGLASHASRRDRQRPVAASRRATGQRCCGPRS
jgi:hypothetical protein